MAEPVEAFAVVVIAVTVWVAVEGADAPRVPVGTAHCHCNVECWPLEELDLACHLRSAESEVASGNTSVHPKSLQQLPYAEGHNEGSYPVPLALL